MRRKLYINSKALQKMDAHSITDLDNEVGGFLVGNIDNETTNIEDFLPANSGESKSTSFKFTEADWKSLYEVIDNDSKINLIGWFHTHPDFGAFLSSYDEFIQHNFFSDNGRVAIVFDPIRQEWAAFLQSEGNTEKIKLKESQKVIKPHTKERKRKSIIYSTILSLSLALVAGYIYLDSLRLKSEIINTQEEFEIILNEKNELIKSTKVDLENQISALDEKTITHELTIVNLETEIRELKESNNQAQLEIEALSLANSQLEELSEYFTYTVKEGDTLNKISKIFGTSVDSLYSLNKEVIGLDLNVIEIGQTLIIKIKN